MIYLFVSKFLGQTRPEQHEAAYRLLFSKLREVYSVDVSSEIILTGSNGKPYFKDIPISFNISHCRGYVCAAFCRSDEGNVGTDCEMIRPYKKNMALKYFTDKENIICEDNDKIFTELFSLRESYVKYTGTGIAGHFKDISFDIWEGNILTDRKDISFYAYDIEGGIVTLCAERDSIVCMEIAENC